MSEANNVLDLVTDDLNVELGKLDNLMRRDMQDIRGGTLEYREIMNKAYSILWLASKCESLVKAKEIAYSYTD